MRQATPLVSDSSHMQVGAHQLVLQKAVCQSTVTQSAACQHLSVCWRLVQSGHIMNGHCCGAAAPGLVVLKNTV